VCPHRLSPAKAFIDDDDVEKEQALARERASFSERCASHCFEAIVKRKALIGDTRMLMRWR
jgi:hypothetical protein